VDRYGAFGCTIMLQACQHLPQVGQRRSTPTVSGSTVFSVAGSPYALEQLGSDASKPFRHGVRACATAGSKEEFQPPGERNVCPQQHAQGRSESAINFTLVDAQDRF
jgi:hypothetical protein